jgi:hypothetical protein
MFWSNQTDAPAGVKGSQRFLMNTFRRTANIFALCAMYSMASRVPCRAQIRNIVANRQNGGFYEVLSGVAKFQSNDNFQKLLAAQLYNANHIVAHDAAVALGRCGSAASEAVLWKRLQIFHDGLKGRKPTQLQKYSKKRYGKLSRRCPTQPCSARKCNNFAIYAPLPKRIRKLTRCFNTTIGRSRRKSGSLRLATKAVELSAFISDSVFPRSTH